MNNSLLGKQNALGIPRIGSRTWLMWGCFGALSAIRLNLGGEIYLGEIFAVVGLFLYLKARAVRASDGWLLLAGIAFASAQLLSDLYNQTPLQTSIKGVGAPLVFCMTIVTLLTIFEHDIRRLYPLLAGVVMGQLVQIVVSPDAYIQLDPWKWGYGQVVLTAGLIWFSVRPPRQIAVLWVAMLLFSVATILQNARSLAGLPMIGLTAYMIWRSPGRSAFKSWLQQGGGAFKLLILLLPLVVVLNTCLGILFTSHWVQSKLSPAVAAKYRQQAQSEVGMLLAGRSEWLVSSRAFMDAPLLGHGSWAKDKGNYRELYDQLRIKYGIVKEGDTRYSDETLIPAHSFLMGAMVWSGITGGIFWLVFAYQLIQRYLRAARYLPLYFHVGIVMFIWNLLFSPFGAQARWQTALFVAAFLAAARSREFFARGDTRPRKLPPALDFDCG